MIQILGTTPDSRLTSGPGFPGGLPSPAVAESP